MINSNLNKNDAFLNTEILKNKPTFNKIKCQELLNILSKFNDENLLIKIITYKIKNQMHKYKQFKYLVEIKRFITKHIIQGLEFKKSTNISISKIRDNYVLLDSDKINYFEDLLIKQGLILLEMLNLKLHCQYSCIILAICSRINLLVKKLIEDFK